jgi:hypothetical protein
MSSKALRPAEKFNYVFHSRFTETLIFAGAFTVFCFESRRKYWDFFFNTYQNEIIVLSYWEPIIWHASPEATIASAAASFYWLASRLIRASLKEPHDGHLKMQAMTEESLASFTLITSSLEVWHLGQSTSAFTSLQSNIAASSQRCLNSKFIFWLNSKACTCVANNLHQRFLLCQLSMNSTGWRCTAKKKRPTAKRLRRLRNISLFAIDHWLKNNLKLLYVLSWLCLNHRKNLQKFEFHRAC